MLGSWWVAEGGEYSPRVSSPPPAVPLPSQVFQILFTPFFQSPYSSYSHVLPGVWLSKILLMKFSVNFPPIILLNVE